MENKNIIQRFVDWDWESNEAKAIKKATADYYAREKAEADIFSRGTYRNVMHVSFNGEKNMGEAGPIVDYTLDYDGLRFRSWQSYIESEVTQTILKKFSTWCIGNGLKLTSEPAKFILEWEGIKINTLDFSKKAEQRFNIYKNSKASSFSGMESIDAIANTAYINAAVGGDVLVILRYDGRNVTVQLVDGCHVVSPRYGTEFYPEKLANGNEIANGIEYSKDKKHVRYYVRNKDYTFTTIEAFGKRSGLQMAYMVKGLDYRLDNMRGMPLIAVVLEKLKKLERYESATIGSAEERQKIVYQVVHTKNSTGETPLTKAMATVRNANAGADTAPDITGKELANTIAVSTNKQTFNMGLDSELKALESKNELYFKDFYTTNIKLVCGSLGIPYAVAFSDYDGSYSSSRAAIKDWENTLMVARKKFSDAFYQPIYNFWLETQILEGKIEAPGYVLAKIAKNDIVIEAYRKNRFVGANVPHIDPLKEVLAIREMLGETGASLPLTTLEEATEKLNNGDSHDNMQQYADEHKESVKLGLFVEDPKPNANEIKKKKNEAALKD